MKFTYVVTEKTTRNAASELLKTPKFIGISSLYMLFVFILVIIVTSNVSYAAMATLVSTAVFKFVVYKSFKRNMSEFFGASGTEWKFDFGPKAYTVKSKSAEAKVPYNEFGSIKVLDEFILLKKTPKSRMTYVLPRPNEDIVQLIQQRIMENNSEV